MYGKAVSMVGNHLRGKRVPKFMGYRPAADLQICKKISCQIWDLAGFGLGHWIGLEILCKMHVLNVHLLDSVTF